MRFAFHPQPWEEVPPPKPSSRSPLGRVACAEAHATALSSVGAERRLSRQPFGCASRSLDNRPSAPEHQTLNSKSKQKGAQSATVLQAHRSMRICFAYADPYADPPAGDDADRADSQRLNRVQRPRVSKIHRTDGKRTVARAHRCFVARLARQMTSCVLYAYVLSFVSKNKKTLDGLSLLNWPTRSTLTRPHKRKKQSAPNSEFMARFARSNRTEMAIDSFQQRAFRPIRAVIK